MPDNDKMPMTITLEKDGEDLVLPLNPDLLAQMGWDIGDTLLWEQIDDNSWSLRKKEDE